VSRRGRFLSFEGIEGSGKSTLCASLAEALRAAGRDVMTLREPGGTEFGEAVRQVVLDRRHDEVSPLAELYLMLAARSQLCERVIRPELDGDRWLLCDRFMDASTAYQGAGRGLGAERVRRLNAETVVDCLPDRTLLVDLDPQTGLSRQTGDPDRFGREELEFFARVREGYLAEARADSARFVVLDGSLGREELLGTAWKELCRLDPQLPKDPT